MDWRVKYMIQKSLSLLPGQSGMHMNHVLSRRFGGLRDPKFFGFANTLAMCDLLRRNGFDTAGKTFVELGTGWTASSALILLSLGADTLESFDIFRHLDDDLIAKARAAMDNLDEHTTKAFPFPCDLASLGAECRREAIDLEHFHYHAPHDARTTGLADDSVDCYFSQAVLEHVPASIIPDLLKESMRILKPGGLCFHYVQPTSHGAWTDARATGIDYLTCSDWTWRYLYENGIAHENRLRAPEHVALIEACGIEILGTWKTIDEKALQALSGKQVAPRFRAFTPEELATDYIWILGRKPATPATASV